MALSAKAQNRRDRDKAEKDDFYPTPPAATLSLLMRETFSETVWEPACGDGAISKVLIEAGYHVISTDLVDRGYGTSSVDFLLEFGQRQCDIVTNPPFKLLLPFLKKCVGLGVGKFAIFGRLNWLEGQERYNFFREYPPVRVWVFSKRLTLYRNGDDSRKVSGAIAYAWFVWEKGFSGKTELDWIV